MIKYKEFILSDLFEIVGTKSLDEGKLKFIDDGINFVGRVCENNGVKGKIEKQQFEPNEPNTITVTVIGNYKYVKYQQEPYYCSQNINKLIPRFQINEKIAIYFIAKIQKFVSQYNGQQGGYKLEELKNFKIKLPLNNSDDIDYCYIEEYISELEEERISELSAYLEASGLNDYKLTKQDIALLKENKNTKKYKLGDIFEIKSSKKKFNANTVKFDGMYPYVARSSSNNGIRGFINQDEKYLNESNTISFGQDTATMFYQDKPYFTGDKIKIMKLRNKELNDKIACYLITVMKKSFQVFAWGQTSFNEEVLKNVEIELPTNDGEIDYDYMEKFITVIQKISIKDVIVWKDSVISATKKCLTN